MNDRNDLSGIPWDGWRAFSIGEAFHTDLAYLKAVLAAGFGDQLCMGQYGSVPQTLQLGAPSAADKKKPPNPRARAEGAQAVLRSMSKSGVEPRRTVVFPDAGGKQENLTDYVQLVCGERPQHRAVKVSDDDTGDYSLLELDMGDETGRWQPLWSRAEAPLLVAPSRLPAEFNLLTQFEKAMRDLARSKSSAAWSYGVVASQHPCVLQWEAMQPPMTNRGTLCRSEAVYDRKNAVGVVSYVQE